MILIVYFWIAFALAGLGFAIAARQNAKDELKDLGAITNGRRRLGRGHVRDETIVAVINGVWALIGIVYLASGQVPSSPFIAIPLNGTSALLAYSTYARWQDRLYASRPHEDPTDPEVTAANAEEDLYFGEQRRERRDIAIDEAIKKDHE